MKTLKKLFFSIIIFGFCYSFEKVLFGILYYISVGLPPNMISKTIFASITGSINNIYPNVLSIIILYVIQSITELILFSVFTSYVFAYLLNRNPKIIFPDKLVIRHRTSEGLKGKIYLCVMIGNKSKIKIHNISCTLSCYYIQENDPKKANGEFKMIKEQPSIDNYFRFSYELDNFPKKIIKDYIANNELGNKYDVIKIYLKGNTNTIGNNFLLEKTYKLKDIVIAENYIDLKYDFTNIFTGKPMFKKVKWKYIKKIENISKEQKQLIKKELWKIANSD